MGGQKTRRLGVLTVLLLSQAPALLLMVGMAWLRHASFSPGAWMIEAAIAGLTGLIGLAALYRGMAVGVVSIVAAIAATAPVVPLAAGLVRGERPSVLQLGGVALALSGVVLLAFDRRRGAAGARVGPGVGLAVLAALAFGVFLLTLRDASLPDPIWGVMVTRASSVAALLVIALVFRSRLRPARRDMPGLIVIGTLDVSADVLYAIAATTALLSLISILASLYPAVTVVLARTILGERIARLQQVGLALAFGGVLLISV
jgi:drug/metabolite transporter (DMT)-like permease